MGALEGTTTDRYCRLSLPFGYCQMNMHVKSKGSYVPIEVSGSDTASTFIFSEKSLQEEPYGGVIERVVTTPISMNGHYCVLHTHPFVENENGLEKLFWEFNSRLRMLASRLSREARVETYDAFRIFMRDAISTAHFFGHRSMEVSLWMEIVMAADGEGSAYEGIRIN